MKPLAWKDYARDGIGPHLRGEIVGVLAHLKARAGSGDRGSIECAKAVDIIKRLLKEATDNAKRAHLMNEKANSHLVVVDEMRRQSAEMKQLIGMQQQLIQRAQTKET